MRTIGVRRGVLAVSLAMALGTPAAFAQNTSATPTPAPAPAPSAQGNTGSKPPATLEKVTVTGSRIPRSEIEGPAPVSITTGEQIQAQGFTTLFEFLNSLPQVAATDFSDRISTWGNTAVNARPINLRNLGPDHTLLLIDGYRVPDYPMPGGTGQNSFQNYNNIPVGMVDRIEVLGSGASSIYGSDAVAGVVNVVLKKNYQGDEIKVTGGGATRGGRDYGDFLFKGGHSSDKWRVMYSYEHTNRSPLFGRDRDYTDSESDAGYGAYNASARMFGYPDSDGLAIKNADGNYIAPPAGSCSQFGNNFKAYDHKTVGTSGDQVLANQVTDAGTSCVQQNLFSNWVLSPGLRADNAFVSGEYDITEHTTAYANIGLYTNTGTTQTQLPFLYAMSGIPNDFYDKTTGQIIDGYTRQLTPQEMGSYGNTHDYETNWDIHTGLRGTLFDSKFNWNIDLGSSKYIVHEDYTGLNEQGMFDFFFGQQQGTTTIGGTTYPVYQLNTQRYYSPITPAQYSTFAVGGENSAETWMNQATFNLNGDLFDDWAGPIGFAGVFEFNHEGFALSPDPRGNTTTFGDPFQNYITGGGTRTRYSGATEFRVPLADSLTWTISGRLDKYDDHSIADVARTWGTGIEWRPLQGVLIRGSYGTNFHAPDMEAIYLGDNQQTVGYYNDPLECIKAGDRTCAEYQHNTYFTQFSGGSPNLLPETGHSWTYGFVWDIPGVEGLTWSTDYWHMGINNAIKWIGLSDALTDEAGCLTGQQYDGTPYTAHTLGSQYCKEAIANVQRDAAGNITSVTVGPINEASLYVSGIDTDISYKFQTEHYGNFNFDLQYSNNLSYKERDLASDPLLNTRYEYPATKTDMNLMWHYTKWEATLHGSRYSPVRANNYGGCEVLSNGIQPALGDPSCVIYKGYVPAWIVFSTDVKYAITDKIQVGLSISNIFNRVGEIPYYAGGFEFIPEQQGADYTGREIFLSLDWKLD